MRIQDYEKFKIYENVNNNIEKLLKLSETSKPTWEKFDISSLKDKLYHIKYNISKYSDNKNVTDSDAFQLLKDYLDCCEYSNLNSLKCINIYRAINIYENQEIKGGLGKYWANKYNKAIVYNDNRNNIEKNEIILVGCANLNDIDWDFTLGTDYEPDKLSNYGIPLPIEEWQDDSFESESEIRLKDNSIVFLKEYHYMGKIIKLNKYFLV